jgi:hypothetical protein
VLGLRALVSRLTEPDRASDRFDRLRRAANERVGKDAKDFSAWDFLGLARCADVVDGSADLGSAIDAFRKSKDQVRPAALGLTARLTFMLRILDGSSVPGSLQPAINEITGVA